MIYDAKFSKRTVEFVVVKRKRRGCKCVRRPYTALAANYGGLQPNMELTCPPRDGILPYACDSLGKQDGRKQAENDLIPVVECVYPVFFGTVERRSES